MNGAKFKQEIIPESRGRIRYCVSVVLGSPTRIGHRVSRNFAIATNDFVQRRYTLTHLPSGCSIPYLYPRTKKEAAAMARKMERTVDCSRTMLSDRHKAQRKKLKAVVLQLSERKAA